MDVICATCAGACFGVSRALKVAEKTAKTAPSRIFTLGPLIHNPHVTGDLASNGVQELAEDKIESLQPSDTVIIRTHGISKATMKVLRKQLVNVVDATCPYVKSVHAAVESFAHQGLDVVVLGERNHPETQGITGQVENAFVLEPGDEVPQELQGKRVGVVAQTTQEYASLEPTLAKLEEMCASVTFKNTICDATSKRQEAAKQTAQKVDCMVVIGGKTSANTKRLATLCARYAPCVHVEDPNELRSLDFSTYKRIGITAGASTPISHVETARDILSARY